MSNQTKPRFSLLLLTALLAGSLVLLFAAAEVISLGAYHGLLLAGGGALIAMAHWRNLRASLGR